MDAPQGLGFSWDFAGRRSIQTGQSFPSWFAGLPPRRWWPLELEETVAAWGIGLARGTPRQAAAVQGIFNELGKAGRGGQPRTRGSALLECELPSYITGCSTVA